MSALIELLLRYIIFSIRGTLSHIIPTKPTKSLEGRQLFRFAIMVVYSYFLSVVYQCITEHKVEEAFECNGG